MFFKGPKMFFALNQPHDLINKKQNKTPFHDILTWICEFTPGNKTIYVVFDEESEFSGPRTPKLSLDQVFWKTYSIFLTRS